MAEDAGQTPLEVQQQNAGVAFRAEMAVTNFVLGYWPWIAGIVGSVLLGFLVWGVYNSTWIASQKQATGATAQALMDLSDTHEGTLLPDPSKTLRMDSLLYMNPAILPQVLPNVGENAELADDLVGTADGFMAAAKQTSGPARTESLLYAAELYRIAGNNDARRTALEQAQQVAEGPLAFTVANALAWTDLEAGNVDAAVEVWTTWRDREGGGAESEQAALELAEGLEAAGRAEASLAALRDFVTRFPESPMLTAVEGRIAELDGTDGSGTEGPGTEGPGTDGIE